jgi:hypothetical protein
MVKVFLLIVVGLAGDPTHGETFRTWGRTLAEASERLGVANENLFYLVDEPLEGDTRATGGATRADVDKALQAIAGRATGDDTVFVVFIGHGTYGSGRALFALRGPGDLSPQDVSASFAKIKAGQLVFVNTTSASGPFLEALSGPGRTIVTATRSGAEQYATLFGGPFIDALTSEAADADKNKRISVLEAFTHARAEVERSYKREGLLQTEHAMLDDNGDKAGTQAPSLTEKDGRIAAVISLGTVEGGGVPSDPRLAALVNERRELERRIENLRLLKDNMEPAKYNEELARLATELARKTRELREAEKQKGVGSPF